MGENGIKDWRGPEDNQVLTPTKQCLHGVPFSSRSNSVCPEPLRYQLFLEIYPVKRAQAFLFYKPSNSTGTSCWLSLIHCGLRSFVPGLCCGIFTTFRGCAILILLQQLHIVTYNCHSTNMATMIFNIWTEQVFPYSVDQEKKKKRCQSLNVSLGHSPS